MEEVALKDFVAKALKEIAAGIGEANADADSLSRSRLKGYRLESGDSGGVEFDVAVTATQTSGEDGGAKLKVSVLGIGGEAGGKLESHATQAHSHRIKFRVAAVLDLSQVVKRMGPSGERQSWREI